MSQPTPTVGRVVLFKSSCPEHMGSDTAPVPAIVTRVWSPTCVNLRVLADGHQTPWVTSVIFAEDIDSYDPGEPQEHGAYSAAWGWMPYQKAVHAGTVEPTRHAQ